MLLWMKTRVHRNDDCEDVSNRVSFQCLAHVGWSTFMLLMVVFELIKGLNQLGGFENCGRNCDRSPEFVVHFDARAGSHESNLACPKNLSITRCFPPNQNLYGSVINNPYLSHV